MRARRRLRAVLASLVALGVLLPGCSEDETERYCSALEEEQRTLSELSKRSGEDAGGVLEPTLASFERLREEAPTSLVDEWDTVVFAYRGLVEAVEETGIDPEDYTPGQRPEGVSRQEARALAAVAAELGSTRVLEASRGLEDHAREVCDVELGA